MRFTVLRLKPDAPASVRVDQCAASLGVDYSVIVKTRSTSSSSLTLRGVTARGRSNNPSSRRSTKRCRHLQTVWVLIRRCCATPVLELPSRTKESSALATPRMALTWNAGPTLQCLPLFIGQVQRRKGAAGTHHSYSFVQAACKGHYLLYELQRQGISWPLLVPQLSSSSSAASPLEASDRFSSGSAERW